MKLVMLMYLEEDRALVERLLESAGARVFSELDLQGHAPGAPGWLGTVAAFRSQLAFAVVDDDVAGRVLAAVGAHAGTADPSHPIRAALLDVERTAASRGAVGPESPGAP